MPKPPKGCLPENDGAGGDTVEVEVAGMEVVDPVVPFPFIEALESGRQCMACLIDEGDGVLEPLEAHDPEHGAEELGEVRGAARTHAVLDAGDQRFGLPSS